MNKLEAFQELLQQVDEENRPAVVEKLRAADKGDRMKILEEAGIRLPEDWIAAFRNADGFEVNDDVLDQAAGGCTACDCSSGCDCCD